MSSASTEPLPGMATSVHAAVRAAGIVAVIRLDRGDDLLAVARALAAGGVRALEVTLTTPGALDGIRALTDAGSTVSPPWIVGAGSVGTGSAATAAIDAGAAFIVAPVFDDTVVDVCRARSVACIPGAFTPTECARAAQRAGGIVKLFPAARLGTAFLRDVLAPMPALQIMPTGGIGIADIESWIASGAVAIGLGSSLVPLSAVTARRWDDISALAVSATAALRRARGEALA